MIKRTDVQKRIENNCQIQTQCYIGHKRTSWHSTSTTVEESSDRRELVTQMERNQEKNNFLPCDGLFSFLMYFFLFSCTFFFFHKIFSFLICTFFFSFIGRIILLYNHKHNKNNFFLVQTMASPTTSSPEPTTQIDEQKEKITSVPQPSTNIPFILVRDEDHTNFDVRILLRIADTDADLRK